MIIQNKFPIQREEITLVAQLTQAKDKNKDKIVILIHGGPQGNKNGPDDILTRIALRLASSNISSMQFDFMGQGESSGDYINMTMESQKKDFERVVSYVEELGYKKIGLIGESFGVSCLLNGLNSKFSVLGLLWGAVYLLDETFAIYLTPKYLNEMLENGFIQEGADKIGSNFIEELKKVNNLEDKVKLINVPTILIHGESDSEVPCRQSIKSYEILQEPKKIITVPQGEHCLRKPTEQSIVINELDYWFSKYL